MISGLLSRGRARPIRDTALARAGEPLESDAALCSSGGLAKLKLPTDTSGEGSTSPVPVQTHKSTSGE